MEQPTEESPTQSSTTERAVMTTTEDGTNQEAEHNMQLVPVEAQSPTTSHNNKQIEKTRAYKRDRHNRRLQTRNQLALPMFNVPVRKIILDDYLKNNCRFDRPVHCDSRATIVGLRVCPGTTLTELISALGENYQITVEDTKSGLVLDSTLMELAQDWVKEPSAREGHKYCEISLIGTPIEDHFKVPEVISRLSGDIPNLETVQEKEEKLFICCQRDVHLQYRSEFYSIWLYVISGRVRVKLHAPTEQNLSQYLLRSTGEFDKHDIMDDSEYSFTPQKDTTLTMTLSVDSFLAIPIGWIYSLEAYEDTYIFGGKFFSNENIYWQYTCVARKVAIAMMNGEVGDQEYLCSLLGRLCAKQLSKSRSDLQRSRLPRLLTRPANNERAEKKETPRTKRARRRDAIPMITNAVELSIE